jgi:PAS domain S-box-containing protein
MESTAKHMNDLKHAEALLRGILNASLDGILMMDTDGRIQMANPAAEQALGYKSGQLPGKSVADLLTMPPAQNVEEFLRSAAREQELAGEPISMLITGRGRDGSKLPLSVSVSLSTGEDNSGYTCLLRKVQKQQDSRNEAELAMREAKEIAEAANRAKGDFVATVSHEIRTPMNAVIGMTGLLLETPLTREQREYAETVRSSGENLLEIINDILDFSKIESLRLELEELEFSLVECVEDALDLVAPAAAAKGLEIGYLIEDNTPLHVVADITRVRQVLVNLLSNAVKFTAAGEILVTVSADNKRGSELRLTFAVKDTGTGIAKDRLERLFQPFTQADSSITRHYGGTGLGLAISQRLAALMRGTLRVESTPGEGSTFYFTMTAISKPATTKPRLPFTAKTILLVEANTLSARSIEAQAKRLGLRLQLAASAAEARSLLERYEFDAVLLSNSVASKEAPAMETALAKSKRRKPHVVMLTSLGARGTEHAGVAPAAWLTKPVRSQNLESMLTELFAGGIPVSVPIANAQTGTAIRRSIRILVAEDNPINQKVATKMIKSLGYRADVAGNGLEVLDALKRQPYDLVLMDVQMPEMDGLDATRKIRQTMTSEEAPYIIAMTANAMQGDEEICLAAGMNEYLTKPIRMSDLKLALDRWVEANPDDERSIMVPESSAKPALTGQMAELQSLGGDELVAELMNEFQLQVESDLAEIAVAAKANDYAELQRLGHRLKGGSTTVGIATVTAICTELENASAEKDDRRIALVVERLNREVVRTRTLYGASDTSKNVRILIADDHPVVRFGVRRMLQSHAEYVVVGEASDGKEAIREMREMQPDILLLDLNMPELPGLETLRELTTIQVPTKTILLTSAISQREILEALQLGARGVVLKDALTTDLATCIATVMQGHYWLGRKPVQNLVQVLNDLMEEIKQPPKNTFGLTTRELEIVRLIAQGMTNKDIARECDIAEETVKRHLKNIFDKVGVWNRLELALFAINNHLVGDAPQKG